MGHRIKFIIHRDEDNDAVTGDPHKQRSGVNFTNVFTSSFYSSRSQKKKKLLDLTVFFALLGSVYVRAALKMLVKLTPDLLNKSNFVV